MGRWMWIGGVFAVSGFLFDMDGALAQDTVDSGLRLDEITVTARRRDESIQRIPASIAVFTGSALEERSISNMEHLSSYAPNVTVAPDVLGGDAASSIFIRGVGQTDMRIFADAGVGVYVDGVFVPRSLGGLLDLIDVERVEVLRGPQGTLYGKNTVAGAFSLVSTRPQPGFGGYVQLSAGAFDNYGFKGSVNAAPADNLLVRASAIRSTYDGWGTATNDTDFNGELNNSARRHDKELTAGRLQALWLISEDVEAMFAFDGTQSRGHGSLRQGFGIYPLGTPVAFFVNEYARAIASDPARTAGLPPYDATQVPGDIRRSTTDFPGRNDVDVTGGSVTLSWDLGDLTLKSISAYRELETLSNTDQDGTAASVVHVVDANEQDQLSQELQLGGKSLGGDLEWVLGAFYFDEDASRTVLNETLGALAALGLTSTVRTVLTLGDQSNESLAAYSQGTYHLTDPFSVTAGARWTEERKTLTASRFTHALTNPTVSVPETTRSANWSDVSYRLGVEYQWTDAFMTYVSAAKGFKSGGFNGRVADTLPDNGLVPYDQETLLTYEIGIRSDLFANRMRLNVTGFWNDYDDLQTTQQQIIGGSVAVVVGNAATAELKGVELDLVGLITSNWTVNGSVGYVEGKYTDITGSTLLIVNNTNGVGATVPAGPNSVFPRTPELSWTLGSQYAFDLGPGRGTLTIRGDVSHRDESSPDTNAYRADSGALLPVPEILDATTLLDLRLTHVTQAERFQLSAYVTNLTNEEYRTNAFDSGSGVGTQMFGAPRQWGASFKAKF